MNNEQEKKWREEFEKDFGRSHIFDDGTYANLNLQSEWVGYLAARKAAQVETDIWRQQDINNADMLHGLREKLKDRDQEIERLKKFCNEWVYGEDNPEHYKTMVEKLKERDELIREAVLMIEMVIDGQKLNLTPTEKWLEKATAILNEEK